MGKLSYWKNGMAGFHLTINPQSSLPPSARINRKFISHGISLDSRQLKSLLAGRKQGIATINTILGEAVPSLGQNTSLKLSTSIVDAIMSQSIDGQLSREAPTAMDDIKRRDQVLQHIFEQSIPAGAERASVPVLLRKVPPVGFSLTIHF